jgi:hypothetical protein
MTALLGVFHILAGLVALFNHTYFVAPHQDLVVSVSYDTWGAHLIGGLVVLVAGVGLFTGAMWARVLGVGVAMLSAIEPGLPGCLPVVVGHDDHAGRSRHLRRHGPRQRDHEPSCLTPASGLLRL